MDSNQIAVMSETWFGIISNPRDAFIIIEAARTNVLTRITRRLTDFERERLIRPGAVFCWEETEAGIKRWTDHIRWGPSRVKSVFLIYPQTPSEHDPSNAPLLFKQAFSSTTLAGEKFHIIAYYDLPTVETSLPRVSTDPRLASIIVPPGIYPEAKTVLNETYNEVEDMSSTRSLSPNTFNSPSSLTSSLPSIATLSDSGILPRSGSISPKPTGFSPSSRSAEDQRQLNLLRFGSKNLPGPSS